MGVRQGGDYAVLARGLQGCRNGTIKDTTYKVCFNTILQMHFMMTLLVEQC